jgi:DNA-binding response OmpR family regulator
MKEGRSIPITEAPAAQRTVPRLLVVEDDPDQSRMLCDRLKLYGYAVACADDGPAALEMLQTDSYNGLLLDLNLTTCKDTMCWSWRSMPVPIFPSSSCPPRRVEFAR